jgi:hypothetical protein
VKHYAKDLCILGSSVTIEDDCRHDVFTEFIGCRVCQNAVMLIQRTEAWKWIMKLPYLTALLLKLFPPQPRIRRTFWTTI